MLEFNNEPKSVVTTPPHYHKGSIDVIEFMGLFFKDKQMTAQEGFFIGNIIKYVCRYKDKDGVYDLLKANEYLLKLIEIEQKGVNKNG